MTERKVSDAELAQYEKAARDVASFDDREKELRRQLAAAEDAISDLALVRPRYEQRLVEIVTTIGGVPHHGTEAGLEGQWVVGKADPSRLPKPAAPEASQDKKAAKKK